MLGIIFNKEGGSELDVGAGATALAPSINVSGKDRFKAIITALPQ
jgi:hypothetical protein